MTARIDQGILKEPNSQLSLIPRPWLPVGQKYIRSQSHVDDVHTACSVIQEAESLTRLAYLQNLLFFPVPLWVLKVCLSCNITVIQLTHEYSEDITKDLYMQIYEIYELHIHTYLLYNVPKLEFCTIMYAHSNS